MKKCSREKLALMFTAVIGFYLFIGIIVLPWVKPLFPGDPIQYLFGFIIGILGFVCFLDVLRHLAKETEG